MKRFINTIFASALFASSFHAFAADTNNVPVSPTERTKIEEVVHQYLLNKPEVLVEALQNYQRKQYMEAEQTVKKTQQSAPQFAASLFHQANDPIVGNSNGKVTIVEFFDYQCTHCIDMAPVLSAIIKANPDIRVVFKEFPIRGPVSEFAARAALAANKQGKYYQFNHALLTAKSPLTQDAVLEVAKSVGLNVEQLKKDMNDNNITNQIKANIKLAQDLKLFGTPAFFIGKTNGNGISYIPGQINQSQLQDLINKANQ